MNYAFVSESEAATEKIGALLGRAAVKYGKPCYIALDGDMGVGKTAFMRGVASEASPGSRVKSPTYTIVNEYRRGTLPLFHFDMYRIAEPEDELYAIGFEDYLEKGVCVAEWSRVLGDFAPNRTASVNIQKIGETGREISIYTAEDFPKLDTEVI